MIQVTVDGRLTAQPEVRFSQAGKPWATFTIVSNERRKNQAGEWEDANTTFLRSKMFGQAAESLAGLDKGELVVAHGKLVQNDYEDKDGNKRTSFELIVSSIGRMVTNRSQGGSAPSWPPAAPGGAGAAGVGTSVPNIISGAQGAAQRDISMWDQALSPSGTEEPPF